MRLGRIGVIAAFISLILIFPAPPAAAQSASDSEADIRATIGAQLEAFQRDDWAEAFTYASPTIQGTFGDPDRFSQMVRGGYPMVWRPQSVEFGALRATERGLAQRMFFVGPDGRLHVADYFMIPSGDDWKINGVTLLEGEDLGA